MRALTLFLLLAMAALAGPTYQNLGTVTAPSGTLEVWHVETEGKSAVVLKVKEPGKPGEVNCALEVSQVFDLQAHCEELLKDRTPVKPDSIHVVSTLPAGECSLTFALVRVGSGSSFRVLVVKDKEGERNFMLDTKNWPSLRKLLKKATA